MKGKVGAIIDKVVKEENFKEVSSEQRSQRRGK